METVLAQNLAALMAAHPLLTSQQAVAAAAKRAGYTVDQKTVSRVLRAEVSVQLVTLEALARAFEVEPYQLLVPGLDPRNPQVLRRLSEAEERLYRALEEARRGGTQ